MRHFLAALLAFAALAGVARADVPVPPLKARVTDLTGTLNAQQTGELEARIAAFEARRGSQIAVLMLPTTKPEEIEQYSIRVAEAWKIGRRKVDDGLILVVAKDDRALRIEVGYGLEGAIPDSLARRVIDEKITPRFRAGDFYGGVRDGVDQLIKLAEGEKLPPPQAAASGGLSLPGDWPHYIFVGIVFVFIAGTFLKAMLGRFAGSLATGAGVGLIAWLVFGVAFVGAVGLVIGFLLAFLNTGTGRGGGWSSGGGASWGGGSSGGSWGGGGGGGFGGGGASGRW
ncbi:MAG: YgcG family protein [Betaproteobacteria bacterium]